MSGNRTGRLKAAEKIKSTRGSEFFAKIGKKGGQNSTTGGVYGDSERARQIGSIGGRKSRKGWTLIEETDTEWTYQSKKDQEVFKTVKIG